MTIKKIILANPRGFCAGVVRAIDIVELALDLLPPPIYILNEIVHNHHVVERLRGRGVVFVNQLEEIPEASVCIFGTVKLTGLVSNQRLGHSLSC